MTPISIGALARWIFGELDSRDTVLGIPKENFAVPGSAMSMRLMGQTLAAPLGVAAGPHTQLAQNIVAAWLCGARFIELKTVQVMDEIHVPRPCIDVLDEGYNCEWSQELRIDESFREYLNAWVLIHALAHRLGLAGPGTLFAMSVGYDLAGIQSAKIQKFLGAMRDAGPALDAAVEAVAAVYPAVRDIEIPRRLSNHVTLSTMHGCPPAEIERIARHLIDAEGVDTWVKLNPTLLGPERLCAILNERMGFDVVVPDAAFAHDPRFDEAMEMARHLAGAASAAGLSFGLKLSNTLEVANQRGIFPASEKTSYLSGRALHPLTVTLAHLVTEALDGRVPISFCGGANASNFARLVADGLSPVTVCTDLLKPGGYARLQAYISNLALAMDAAGARSHGARSHGARSLDAFIAKSDARQNLARHAESVLAEPALRGRERPLATKGARPLGAFDCIFAPCQDACPAHQNVADYIHLIALGRPAESLNVILRTNNLPAITGSVCDMPCVGACVRNHYDAPLAIREIKRFATVASPHPAPPPRFPATGVSVAVIGAGPTGLSAAYTLAIAGFTVSLFDARKDLGGLVSAVIPSYRLSAASVASDVARVTDLGVTLRLGTRVGRDVSLEELRGAGFQYVVIAAGAAAGKKLGIAGEGATGVLDALDFLGRVCDGAPPSLGSRVLVIGGGNSAMDAARTARRLVPEGSVTIVYRRTRAQMPADAEEVCECLSEGVAIRDLLAPVEVAALSARVTGLRCQRMRLGDDDASGRPRPVAIDGAFETLPCDTLIVAISQEPVLDFLGDLGIARRADGTIRVDGATGETTLPGVFAGGDVVRGPASIIEAVADGRNIAIEIASRHGVRLPDEPHLDKGQTSTELLALRAGGIKGRTVPTFSSAPPHPALPVEARHGFDEIVRPFTAAEATVEAARCLDCDDLCSLCVTVCPNRANLAYSTEPLAIDVPVVAVRGAALVEVERRQLRVEQRVQIANIADFCNACGNCTTFCPTAGAPFLDKPRFYLDAERFAAAPDTAYRFVREDGALRIEARLSGESQSLTLRGDLAEYRTPRVVARFERAPSQSDWRLVAPVSLATPAAAKSPESIDLAPAATLIALLAAADVVPRV